MNKIYTPNQVALGSYLGGPLAAIYFLKGNFDTLGKDALSKKTILIGTLISIVLLSLMPFIPESTPNSLIPLLYLIPAIIVVKKFQLSKQEIFESPEFSFQSNWKVFGMSLAWLFAFLVVAMGFMFVLESVGIISLA
jgi:hypothetical protein